MQINWVLAGRPNICDWILIDFDMLCDIHMITLYLYTNPVSIWTLVRRSSMLPSPSCLFIHSCAWFACILWLSFLGIHQLISQLSCLPNLISRDLLLGLRRGATTYYRNFLIDNLTSDPNSIFTNPHFFLSWVILKIFLFYFIFPLKINKNKWQF